MCFLFSEDDSLLNLRASHGYRARPAHRPGQPGRWRRRYRPDTPPPPTSTEGASARTTARTPSRSPSPPRGPVTPPPERADDNSDDDDVEILVSDPVRPDTPRPTSLAAADQPGPSSSNGASAFDRNAAEIRRMARTEAMQVANQQFNRLSMEERYRLVLIDILCNLEILQKVCDECDLAGEQILHGNFVHTLRRL